MGGVRKISRLGKRGKVNTTAYGKRFKKKNKRDGYTIKMSNIREKWNKRFSLKANLRNLGLVYDINSDIKPFKDDVTMDYLPADKSIEPMETTSEATPTLFLESTEVSRELKKPKKLKSKNARLLHQEFDTRSKRPVRKTCHLSIAEAEYVASLLQKHGTDYAKMARDKANYDQMTECQLRKKCEELLKSRETRHLKLFKSMDLVNQYLNHE